MCTDVGMHLHMNEGEEVTHEKFAIAGFVIVIGKVLSYKVYLKEL